MAEREKDADTEVAPRASIGERPATASTGPLGESEDKVGQEVAEEEFMRFVDLMALDIDPSTLGDEDKAGLALNKGRIIRAIKNGSLVINENGEPIFTPIRSAKTHPITFYEPTGAAIKEMDRKKLGADVAKLFVVMANVTKTNEVVFSNLRMGDLNVCMAITLLYLG